MSVFKAQSGINAFPVFSGGSAAFEAEFFLVLNRDDPGEFYQAAHGVRQLLGQACISIEVAGSPISEMPDLGSLASVADHGNNNGIIFGASIALESLDEPEALVHVPPRTADPQNMKHAIEESQVVASRTGMASALRWQKRPDQSPFPICEIAFAYLHVLQIASVAVRSTII